MKERTRYPPIPLETALQLCNEIRLKAEQKWHTPALSWCWECQQDIDGDPQKRGFTRKPGNRGCILVNSLYAERYLTQ